MATEKRLIDVTDCPCDGCPAKPCGHPARCVRFALWLNKTVDAVEVKTLEAWLYEIAMNNTNNYLCDACEEIIRRLDGLRVFARERENDGK